MRKIIGMCLLAIICFVTMLVPAFATDFSMEMLADGSISPQFTNISVFQNGFDISVTGMANVNSYLSALGSDQLVIFCEIQHFTNGSWQSIKQWTEIGSDTELNLNRNYYVSRGHSYRMKAVGSVYNNGMLLEQTSYFSSPIYY